MHVKKSLVSLVALCGALFLWTPRANAAEDAEKYIYIKLYSGLEFKGELKESTEDNLVVQTPYGSRTLRRSDIISTRMQLTPEERKELRGLLAYTKKSQDAGAAEAAAAARMGDPTNDPAPRARFVDRSEPRGRAEANGFGAAMPVHMTAYERMARALDKKVTLEFLDTPLVEAVDFINALTRINIIVSPKVRENKPVVSLKVTDMDAGTVIKWMTKLTETYAEVKDQAIWITDKPSKEVEDEEKADIMTLAASLGATVDLPPEGVPLTDADRTRIALQLWEKEQPKVTDFPGPDLSIGADAERAANPFAQP
ncbi:MAG TPA: hypothetical protein VEJ63_23435 [Planctomycetota bacterium]|nr:hypothetical protein [Planctomycetota bacterium]